MTKRNYSAEQIQALCDMYKVVPGFSGHGSLVSINDQIKHGLLFINEDCNAVTVCRDLYYAAFNLYGVDGAQMNQTFYKNFTTVTEKSRFELFVDQCIHYLGTYGRETMGLKPITLIPMQKLEVPDVDLSNIKITVIRVVGDATITALVNETLRTTKAPSKRIVKCMESLIPLCQMNLDDIKSFELMVMAFDFAGRVPQSGKLWLRYAIFKMTGQTLIIKSRKMISAIKNSDYDNLHDMLGQANPVELSRIFLRYKPLFLAMKHHDGCAPLINKLRRMADTYHEPLSDVTIQNYIKFAMVGDRTSTALLRGKMDARDMVKLINAMLLRLNVKEGDPAVYNIRNGRAYCVMEAYKSLTRKERNSLGLEIDRLYDALVDKLCSGIQGKTFYIPEQIRYAVPQSEKQFIGNLPWGTVIIPDNDNLKAPLSVGIHWENTDSHRVDLDLHAFSYTEHFGWNGAYYNDKDYEVIYSGDMTNAPRPHGAAEAFWIKGYDQPVIFTVNEYHGPSEMHFKLFFASERIDKQGALDYNRKYDHPYTMDPNTLIIPPVPMYINEDRTYTIGFFHNGEFYCYSGNLSEGIVPSANYSKFLEGVILQQKIHITMSELISRCGGTVVGTREESDKLMDEEVEVIDLSPEALTATTLMDIVDGKL